MRRLPGAGGQCRVSTSTSPPLGSHMSPASHFPALALPAQRRELSLPLQTPIY